MKFMRTIYALPLVLVFASTSFAAGKPAARKAIQFERWPTDISHAIQVASDLKKYCATPRDQFESREAARDRVFAKFDPPTVSFALRPLLAPEGTVGVSASRRTGGIQEGGVTYNARAQQLSVDVPYIVSTTSLFRRPFEGVLASDSPYVTIKFADEGVDQGSYAAVNSLGATVRVEANKNFTWMLAVVSPGAVERMRRPRDAYFPWRDAPVYTAQVGPTEARALVASLTWRVVVKVLPVDAAECLVDVQKFVSRQPTIANPWREEEEKLFIPVVIVALALVDTRDNTILWQLQ